MSDEEYLGNGTFCYQIAYGMPKIPGWYEKAAASASRLLRNVKVSQRINELLKLVFDDNLADTELAYAMSQKSDISSKVAAIREYNKLKQRIREKEIDSSVRILVLPTVLIQKNDIPISNPDAIARENSSRPAQIPSGESGEKIR